MSARWAFFLQEGGRRNSLFHRSLGSKFFFDMGKDRISFPKGRGHLIKKRSGGKDCLQLVQLSRATSYSTIGYRQLLSTLRFWRLGLLMGLLLSTRVRLRHQPLGVCSLISPSIYIIFFCLFLRGLGRAPGEPTGWVTPGLFHSCPRVGYSRAL